MRKITQEELKEILENHKHWMYKDCDGWENMRADLCAADLYGVNLHNADLRYANLCKANLRNANLYGANLQNADLCNADLCWTNLCHANLRNADLRDADLCNANLYGAKNVPFIPYSCPDVGSFIGYKKAKNGIVALEILADARRCSATGRKCRCDKARVLGIYDRRHTLLDITETVSIYDAKFKYVVGEIVKEPNYCEDRWSECSEGIHFFINFQEAVDYK